MSWKAIVEMHQFYFSTKICIWECFSFCYHGRLFFVIAFCSICCQSVWRHVWHIGSEKSCACWTCWLFFLIGNIVFTWFSGSIGWLGCNQKHDNHTFQFVQNNEWVLCLLLCIDQKNLDIIWLATCYAHIWHIHWTKSGVMNCPQLVDCPLNRCVLTSVRFPYQK